MSEQGQTNTREIAKCVYSISAGGGSTQKHARRCRSAVGLVFLSNPQRRRTPRFSGPGYDNKRFGGLRSTAKRPFMSFRYLTPSTESRVQKREGYFGRVRKLGNLRYMESIKLNSGESGVSGTSRHPYFLGA
ncbi:unnamed protein product [Pylaiella littoralis]